MNNGISYKLLEQQDLASMMEFVDDENTKYDTDDLERFINTDNACGFVAKDGDKTIAFAFGYVMLRPDGRKMFYLHAIDVMSGYQGKGSGTGLMQFICGYAKELGCYEVFVITNKSNVAACKCYEKTGAKSECDDDIVYVYNLATLTKDEEAGSC